MTFRGLVGIFMGMVHDLAMIALGAVWFAAGMLIDLAIRRDRYRLAWISTGIAVALMVTGASFVHADCPADGEGGDPVLNQRKNRTDQPARPTAMDVPQLLELKGTATRAPRTKWTAAQRASVADMEGQGVVVVGYLLGAKEEGQEAANCHGEEHDEHDFHVWLAHEPGDPKSKAVVVEVTPRQHDKRWTLAALHRLARQHIQVRVTGWLMFDQEHGPDVGRSRGTLWEIHPITGIEEMRGGAWRAVGAP